MVEGTDKTSIPRNEALHIALLTKALQGDSYAKHLFTETEAIEILKKKISHLTSEAKESPLV